jgi:hypothetical protein
MSKSYAVALGIAGLACVGATVVSLQDHAAAQTASVHVGQPGRYQIVHSPHIQKNTMLLDTETGRTWSLGVDKDENYTWEPDTWVGR